MILTQQTLAEAASTLAQRDDVLSEIFKKHGNPPLWRRPATFPTLVRIILEQQVSLRSADAMYRRLHTALKSISPETFLLAGEMRLRQLGVTRQKTAYLLHLSSSIVDGNLRLRQLYRMTDSDAKDTLMRIKGIGSWSADVYLLMALRRADIWPAGDLALAVAVKDLHRLPQKPSTDELERFAERWRPYRAVAARMLWQYYLAHKRGM